MPDYGPDVALIVVDVQNDFADPKGSLYVKGGEGIVPMVNAEIARAHGAGSPVFYTQDWHPAHTPHFQSDGGIWPSHGVGGTWGAEFYPGLEVSGEVIKKGTGGEDGYSGFTVADPATGDRSQTALAGILREHGITRLIIAGLATDYCVKDTAIDGTTLGFATVVLAGATRAVDLSPGDGDRALDAMAKAHVMIE